MGCTVPGQPHACHAGRPPGRAYVRSYGSILCSTSEHRWRRGGHGGGVMSVPVCQSSESLSSQTLSRYSTRPVASPEARRSSILLEVAPSTVACQQLQRPALPPSSGWNRPGLGNAVSAAVPQPQALRLPQLHRPCAVFTGVRLRARTARSMATRAAHLHRALAAPWGLELDAARRLPLHAVRDAAAVH